MFALSTVALFASLLITAPSSLVGASPTPSPHAAITNATTNVATTSSYWLASIKRQGTIPFGNSSSYVIYRNVMDFGAKGKS